jgi:hypothetical protein
MRHISSDLSWSKVTLAPRYHALAEEAIPIRKIAEVIGRGQDAPVVSKSSKQAARHFSWLTPFIEADNPVSSQLTQERPRWRPAQPGIMSDLDYAG